MRCVLLGTVQSTEVALRTLAAGGRPPVEVVTLSADRSGRHSDFVDLVPIGSALGVPVTPVASARTGELERVIQERDADLLLVIGWSEILPDAVLCAAPGGAIGYHPSPLPELRGRGVLPWTVLLQRQATAGTLFWLNDAVDDGDIAFQHHFCLDPRETATTLYAKHMDALVTMLQDLLVAESPQELPRTAQHGTPSWCAQRRPVDGLIDWTDDAEAIDRLVRATSHPYPGARAIRARDRAEVQVWASTPLAGESFHGLPGQVVAVRDGHALVTCGRELLRIDEASTLDGSAIELRTQDRFLPHPLALDAWDRTHAL